MGYMTTMETEKAMKFKRQVAWLITLTIMGIEPAIHLPKGKGSDQFLNTEKLIH